MTAKELEAAVELARERLETRGKYFDNGWSVTDELATALLAIAPVYEAACALLEVDPEHDITYEQAERKLWRAIDAARRGSSRPTSTRGE